MEFATSQDILKKIRVILKMRKITIKDFSIKMGNSNFLHHLEKGDITFTVDLLLQILKVLEISFSDFFLSYHSKFLLNYKYLNENEQDLIRHVVYVLKNR